MPPLKPVSSSTLFSIGWNPATRRLVAQFGEDVFYEYDDVPADVAARIMFSESHGQAFDQLVKKGGFGYRRINREAATAD